MSDTNENVNINEVAEKSSKKETVKKISKNAAKKTAKKETAKKAVKKTAKKEVVLKEEKSPAVKKETVKKTAKKAVKKAAKKAVKKDSNFNLSENINLSSETNNLKEILIDTPEKKEKRAAEDLEQAKEHFEHVVEEVIQTSLYTLDYLAEKTDALIDRTEIKIKDCYSKASKFYDKYPLLTSTILTTATTIFAKAIKLKMKLNKKK